MPKEERIRFLYAAGTTPVGGAQDPDRKKNPVVVEVLDRTQD